MQLKCGYSEVSRIQQLFSYQNELHHTLTKISLQMVNNQGLTVLQDKFNKRTDFQMITI